MSLDSGYCKLLGGLLAGIPELLPRDTAGAYHYQSRSWPGVRLPAGRDTKGTDWHHFFIPEKLWLSFSGDMM